MKTSKKCYLCNKGKPVYKFHKLGYSVYQCPDCNLLFLDFHKNYKSFIHSYYQKGYFTGNNKIRAYANYKEDKPNILKNAHNILKKVKKIKPKGLVLDVGCAMGFFMEEAENQGLQAYGIEISKYASSFIPEKFRNRVFQGSVEEFCQKRLKLPLFKNLSFDLIILSDIIEHVKDPVGILRCLRKTLSNDGIVIIQTGDSDSFWAKIMKKNWHFFAPPQHLYFFSKKTLEQVLNQAGYKVITVHKEGKYVSLRYILHMTQYMNIPNIGDYLYQLTENGPIGRIPFLIKLFDNMVVFAKKD